MVKEAFLKRFAQIEDPQDTMREAIEAVLVASDLPEWLQKLIGYTKRQSLTKGQSMDFLEELLQSSQNWHIMECAETLARTPH